MPRVRCAAVAAALAVGVAVGAGSILSTTVAEVAQSVEEVRGRRFARQVPASEIDLAGLRRVLRSKIVQSFPAPPEETLRSLAALGLLEEEPNLLERLIDFYASQVIAFYDPEPRKFFLVRGAETALGGAEEESLAERLIFSHELTHALQDETLRLDSRLKELRQDGDRALALECLLEGEATLVMIRVALADLPGAEESTEEMLGPLLSPGALERANVPKDVPKFFVEQLFFPYVEGTAYVRRAVNRGGWAEVDRLWRDPPQSTSEILHEGPIPPPAQGLLPANLEPLCPPRLRPLYCDTLGEWAIRFLLRRSLEEKEADLAAEGWRGDRIAFFSSGNRIAYLWRLRFDTAEAAERFERAWRKSRKATARAEPELFSRIGRDLVTSSGFAKIPELPGFPAPRPLAESR